jgi:hypothetical protein
LYSCMALPRDSVFFAEVLLIDNAILVHDKRHDARRSGIRLSKELKRKEQNS